MARQPATAEKSKEQKLGTMIVCDLCSHYRLSGECRLGLRLPKGMRCRDFGSTL